MKQRKSHTCKDHALCYGDTTPRHYEQHYTHETTTYDDAPFTTLILYTRTTIMTPPSPQVQSSQALSDLSFLSNYSLVFFVSLFCCIWLLRRKGGREPKAILSHDLSCFFGLDSVCPFVSKAEWYYRCVETDILVYCDSDPALCDLCAFPITGF